ncbi:MAG TPA: hypothetical protein VM532_11025, partial [Burkholderiales bacterium]|nr:hypothetical protein [Burkholderiales bacterium]
AEAAIARDAAALRPGSIDDLAALRVPLTATLHEFDKAYQHIDDALRDLQSKRSSLEADIGERERELSGLTAAGEIATHEQVQGARLRRDDGWRLVRKAYVERSDEPERLAADFFPGQPLPTGFETAMREADRLADLLHADAERATHFEITRKRIEDMRVACTGLSHQCDSLSEERRRLDNRWGSIAVSLGHPHLTPASTIEWSQKHAAWMERYIQLDALRRDRQEIASLLATTRAGLNQALIACRISGLMESESLSAALARAKVASDAARQAATARAALLGQITQQESDRDDATSQQARVAEQLNSWRSQWTETVAALSLPATALPAEARARIDELKALSSALDSLEALIREAELEREKRDGFERMLAQLTNVLGESHVSKDADHLVAMLYDELAAARETDHLRRQIDADIEREVKRLQQSQLIEASQRERLAEMVRRAGAQSPDELPLVEEKSQRKRLLSDRVSEIGEQLVRSAARPLTEVLAEVAGHEISQTAARLTEIEDAIKQHEPEVEAAYGQLLEAKRAFDAIDGGDAAAQAQQEAEELIARIGRHARAYTRSRLAQAVVARVIQSYRERHQGPVLRRAGEIFAKITLGSFSGLVTDYDNDAQVLLGQRPDGGRVGVAGMSQGSRDQLFLALRIAAIEEHMKGREAIPLVIDDLLVQFDDARASATLAVLAELAQRTQVLFFTHHGHVCELADGVLQKGSWRRHDLRAAAYSVTPEE